jgi:hypothetical protein
VYGLECGAEWGDVERRESKILGGLRHSLCYLRNSDESDGASTSEHTHRTVGGTPVLFVPLRQHEQGLRTSRSGANETCLYCTSSTSFVRTVYRVLSGVRRDAKKGPIDAAMGRSNHRAFGKENPAEEGRKGTTSARKCRADVRRNHMRIANLTFQDM